MVVRPIALKRIDVQLTRDDLNVSETGEFFFKRRSSCPEATSERLATYKRSSYPPQRQPTKPRCFPHMRQQRQYIDRTIDIRRE
jgi:hypothetical protein